MKIGYARVSTDEQNIDLQSDALTAAGCSKLFTDQVSGSTRQRPGLDRALALMKPGDSLVVWKLDRLGRSLAHLIDIIRQLSERGCGFQSLTEGMDTATPHGELLFNLVGSFAQFERALIIERTKAGLAKARQRGAMLGRRRVLSDDQMRSANVLLEKGESVTSAARSLKVSRATLYRAIATRKQ